MFGFFKKKKRLEKLEKEIQDSFEHVKKDFGKVSQWITHLDGKHTSHEDELDCLKDAISELKNDMQEVKDFVSFFGPHLSKQLFKQTPTAVQKQTGGEAVQTPVQTAVQTGFLEGLTVMERAIVWALINADMKLSYEDLAALLGKGKSTIRGQINGIKQKSESLIKEVTEPNGKKRLYVPEETRNFILKSVKVRVDNKNKSKKKKKE